jgi:hypothetical protein
LDFCQSCLIPQNRKHFLKRIFCKGNRYLLAIYLQSSILFFFILGSPLPHTFPKPLLNFRLMTCKEHHRIGRRAASPEGCWKLAVGNTHGERPGMILRPGGAPEKLRLSKVLKVIKGIIPKFTVNLGWLWCWSVRPRVRLCPSYPSPLSPPKIKILPLKITNLHKLLQTCTKLNKPFHPPGGYSFQNDEP